MILAHWPALFACVAQAMLALLALRARDPLGAPPALFGSDLLVWNFADLASKISGLPIWHVLDITVSPLTPVLGLHFVLFDQAEFFEIIVDQADRLERLISTDQRIGRLEPELARVDVGALVRDVDAVITDLRMPGMDGMTLLGRIIAEHPGTPGIMFTAHGTVPLAVEAMKRGAAEFVLEPFAREELLFVVHKALAGAAHAGSRPPEVMPAAGRNTCASAAMRECQSLVTRAAAGTATVLLRGESGTGKEVAARSIHEQSPRRKGPFVRVHCAALPDALLESELFGYEKGAFTGAVQRKPGRVELSQGGTLFLDEIGDTTPRG